MCTGSQVAGLCVRGKYTERRSINIGSMYWVGLELGSPLSPINTVALFFMHTAVLSPFPMNRDSLFRIGTPAQHTVPSKVIQTLDKDKQRLYEINNTCHELFCLLKQMGDL